MDNTTRLILMLDREFDKTVESIINKKALMERTGDFREIATLAAEAAELEEYLGILFNMAQEILGV
jgi:hypothetical protein